MGCEGEVRFVEELWEKAEETTEKDEINERERTEYGSYGVLVFATSSTQFAHILAGIKLLLYCCPWFLPLLHCLKDIFFDAEKDAS